MPALQSVIPSPRAPVPAGPRATPAGSGDRCFDRVHSRCGRARHTDEEARETAELRDCGACCGMAAAFPQAEPIAAAGHKGGGEMAATVPVNESSAPTLTETRGGGSGAVSGPGGTGPSGKPTRPEAGEDGADEIVVTGKAAVPDGPEETAGPDRARAARGHGGMTSPVTDIRVRLVEQPADQDGRGRATPAGAGRGFGFPEGDESQDGALAHRSPDGGTDGSALAVVLDGTVSGDSAGGREPFSRQPAASQSPADPLAGESSGQGEMRPASATDAASVRAISDQIAAATTKGQGGAMEVSLSPKELGHLRMTLSPENGVMTMTLVAERSDTLDLLRRNIGDLASDLHDLGFGTLNFQFRQEGRQGSAGDWARVPDPPQPASDTAPPRPATLAQSTTVTGVLSGDLSGGALDLRF